MRNVYLLVSPPVLFFIACLAIAPSSIAIDWAPTDGPVRLPDAVPCYVAEVGWGIPPSGVTIHWDCFSNAATNATNDALSSITTVPPL